MNHGTPGEREIQAQQHSEENAQRFYDRQMHDRLSDKMVELIARQEMMFIATSDAGGNCDCSPRFGSPGFVHVLDAQTIAYPEYRGNGVFASLGNLVENPHIGIVFVDFFDTTVGLHVNGAASSYHLDELPENLVEHLDAFSLAADSTVQRWVTVNIDEAYIHCSKHVPLLSRQNKPIQWGTDDPVAKSTDYFEAG
ncbi:MAG: pyridoxamine 5'-phosphate oxidase family protein [Pirellulales bacterium]